MKKWIFTLAVAILCTACKRQDNAFEAFAEHFGKTATFAYAQIGNRQVLLVSHEVFGGEETDGLEAVAASVFALDADGKIVSLGSVRSQGTLYPISVADNKLMVAGHRFVSIYDIRGEAEPELTLCSHEEGDSESPALQALFQTFEQGEPVIFQTARP